MDLGQRKGEVSRGVESVPEDRKSVIVTVNPNLMGPTCEQGEPELGGFAETFLEDKPRGRALSPRHLGAEGPAVIPASAVQRLPFALAWRHTGYESAISPVHGVVVKLPGQYCVGVLPLRHDDEPGSVFVQSMHNARPERIGTAAEGMAKQQPVDQGAPWMPRAGMDHESPGLVHDHQEIILVPNVQRHLLGVYGEGLWGGNGENDLLLGPELPGCSRTYTVYRHEPCSDQFLEACSGDAEVIPAGDISIPEEVIQADSVICFLCCPPKCLINLTHPRLTGIRSRQYIQKRSSRWVSLGPTRACT